MTELNLIEAGVLMNLIGISLTSIWIIFFLQAGVFLYPTPLFKRKRPDVLITLYADPVFLIGWIIAKIRGVRVGFWVEKTFDSWVKRTKFKETIKKLIFPRVDFILTVGNDGT